MTPQEILSHVDSGELWAASSAGAPDMAAAYQQALAVRALRVARGEVPRGYKIGFTNRAIWPVYQVFAPIWGTVYDTTLSFAQAQGIVSLTRTSLPRLEPEVVFGLRCEPPDGCSTQQLFESIEWLAPGFEIVQSHQAGWKFTAPDTAADGALHARLLVGRKVPVAAVARQADELEAQLARMEIILAKGNDVVDRGRGANALDGPLHALAHFVQEMRQCPGAPKLLAGDVITTGTLTAAWPVAPGEVWSAHFQSPLSPLEIRFS